MIQLGLIGFPLTHSFSKKYFSEKFDNEGIVGFNYDLFSIENINEFSPLIKKNPTLFGLNVTIPFKESVIPFIDELDEVASKVGAVNCIKIKRSFDNTILSTKGYNTDVFGFSQSIKPFLESQHERALIIGTGGASKAVQYVLKNIGIDCYFVSRTKKADSKNVFLYEELNENIINAFKLIVNTSPVGMHPNTEQFPDIPYQFIGKSHLLYDLIYNPLETEFLKKGKAQGASIVNGLSMLRLQAEESWRIWNTD